MVVFWVFIISLIDIKTLRIPDMILLCFFLSLLFLDRSRDVSFFCGRLASVAVCFGVFYSLYYFTGGMGYGDVKYAAVLGYALGLDKSLWAFTVASLGGIAVYLAGIKFSRWNASVKIPFAPFLGIGSLAALQINFNLLDSL
ncbi:prepilin peptidase [Breznakiella homolactica]|nr:A24 family peptidase [Breznakiella homolactica]